MRLAIFRLWQGASIVRSVLGPPLLQLLICLIRLSVENFDQQILRSLLHIRACFLLHISSSYAKILGETNFHAREISRSG